LAIYNKINKQNNSLILIESSSGRHSRANSNDSHSGKTTKTYYVILYSLIETD